jgi:adenylyl-sulfate kinase
MDKNMSKPFTVWFTGLSGAGKTTLAIAVHHKIQELGISNMEILDGDVIRQNISNGLGFSKEDRDINIKRIGWVCQLINKLNGVAIVAAISPYRETRESTKNGIKNFIEVYVNCPLQILIKRDVKGLYEKAIKGEIKNFTGISDKYEPPVSPDVIVKTDMETVEQSTAKIMSKLSEKGFI